MKKGLRLLAVAGLMVFSLSSFMPAKNVFTAAEQQQVSIATPGLFAQSQAFNVDFEIFRAKEYSFPLPVGKATLLNNRVLRISTSKGDAVKAMLEGYVRLSRKSESMGNVIVVRHDCGLETVYANNAENLVKVGQHVDAGQTIAIVGSKEGETYCDFSIMVNGGRLNPETFIELKSHKLRRQTVQFRKHGAQVHGVEVRNIAGEFLTMPENIRKMVLEGVDAVMTDQKGVCIGVSTADCIPVLLYDEEHHAVAAIHAGWRGTLARIVHKTIQEMAFTYHTDPKKLKAVIGPGISLDHFEVGDEVYEAFEQAAFPMEEIAEQRPNAAFSVDPAERERLAAEGNIVQPLKWHLNLPLCNRQILLHCGVAEENIQDCGICTFAHSDEYFSARKLGTESGRIYTGILLK